MVVGYIKYSESSDFYNLNNWFSLFKLVEIKCFNDNYIININRKINMDNYENKIIEKRIIKKIKNNIIKKIRVYQIDAIVFSEKICGKFQKSLVDALAELGFSIDTLNGKKLMKHLDFKIMEYIFEKQKAKMENEEIYIIFKSDNNLNLKFKSNLNRLKKYIYKYIYKFKVTNLISNDIRKLRKLQEEILEEENILISISNNKRKALKRARYILNINLNKSDLERYKINRNAIIINLEEYIIYNAPSFNGININYLELDIPDEYQETFEEIGRGFDNTTLYGSLAFEYSSRMKTTVKERIKEDDIQIKYLIGNNGEIPINNLEQLVKNNINQP